MKSHADPRCIASCVAVTTAIAMMLQGKHFVEESGSYDAEALIKEAFGYACATLETDEKVMFADVLLSTQRSLVKAGGQSNHANH